MEIESTELSFLSIFALISFFIFLFTEKILKKSILFLDNDFQKPQSFHKIPTPRIGGLAGVFSFFIFLIIYKLLFDKILYNYLFFGIGLFSLGFLDDIKIKITPNIRLAIMILIISSLILLFSISLKQVDFKFLEYLLSFNIFSTLFILICFLFIINGSNLIDGFNGLLAIHLIIINSILLFINLDFKYNEFSFLIAGQLIILLTFLIFNFPKAKIFLGDSGAYLFGSLTVLNVIYTHNQIKEITAFLPCILLFYLFFEVFFSFFRKIYLKKSPLKPDNNHLHMLSYRFIKKTNKFADCNYLNSLIINTIYLLLIIPGIYFRFNGTVCLIWFFTLLAIYVVIYLRLYSLTEK
jgi:UDP-GlcNAc:undecaprenyl-phosphate GlcNAc-1-phosphate transferase|tara:strand:+ start:485 stop:1540 length:1056 start_codon:yes stop_codon:yes gene_type:complete